MKSTFLVFTLPILLFAFPFLSDCLERQSLETKVRIQVQAALKIIADENPRPSTLIDPRIGESQDSVVNLARVRLVEQGFSTHTDHGIPDTSIALLNLQGVTERDGKLVVSASLFFFASRDKPLGPLPVVRTWVNTYAYPVTCEGNQCVLGEDMISISHGDGWEKLKCLDTFFAPPAERPEGCRKGNPEPAMDEELRLPRAPG